MIDPVQHASAGENRELSADQRPVLASKAQGEIMRPAESAELEDEGWRLDPERAELELPSSWLDRPWMWPLWGIVRIVVFELTTSPGLAVAAFCIKPGITDVRLGWWLWRRDPNPQRGWITGLVAASWMGVKTMLVSLVILIALFVAWMTLGNRANAIQIMDVILECSTSLATTTVVALCVSLATSQCGFHLAKRGGQKIWLEAGMGQAPLRDEWPPYCEGPPKKNQVIDLAQFIFVVYLPAILALVVWGIVAFDRTVPNVKLISLGMGSILTIWATTNLLCTLWRVAAVHPGQCWPELLQSPCPA